MSKRIIVVLGKVAFMIFLLCCAMNETESYNVQATELEALSDFYNSTNGGSWEWHGSGNVWDFSDPNPCEDDWQGITCSEVITSAGYLSVISLILPTFALNGTIPDSIGNLTQLHELILTYSVHLTGTIPSTIAQCSQLTTLRLSNNSLAGTIPDSLGQLTNLSTLYLNDNHLLGTIPDAIGRLDRLTALGLFGNSLTGTIPSILGQLTQLSMLYLSGNLLHGTIPEALGSLNQLRYLTLNINALTGTLPGTAFANMSQLRKVTMNANMLSGTVPSVFGDLPELQVLYLFQNSLSGTIPASLGNASAMVVLSVDRNHMTGTIPEALGQLTELMGLYLYRNRLTGTMPAVLGALPRLADLEVNANLLSGTIPDALASLTQLKTLYVNSNRLSGTIPQNWSSSAATLAYLHLSSNRFSGTIPAALGRLPLLASLNLSDNHLSGTIPSNFKSLSGLQQLLLQDNKLGGGIGVLFDPTTQANLSAVQLGGNRLTGLIPESAFLLRSLNSFAAVENCFDGPLPADAICGSGTLTVLVLDGMHSASTCRAPLTRRWFKLGALPRCLLEMSNLSTLHLSGSGLTGSLPVDAVVSSALSDLSLSHNLLTGQIPDNILDRDWDKLDLSYNRLTGTLDKARTAPYGNGSSLRLQHNRLSGEVPGSMQRVGSLSLLEDNMFSCRVDGSDLPQQDSDSDKYTCGSDGVNGPLYVWLGVVAVVTVTAGIAMYHYRWTDIVRKWWSSLHQNQLPETQSLFRVYEALCHLGAGCTAFCIAVLMPTYAVLATVYPTYTYKYAWTLSGALLSGTISFDVTVILLLLQLSLCWYGAERLLRRCFDQHLTVVQDGYSVTSTPADKVGGDRTRNAIAMALFSLAVVTGANVGFVYATLELKGRSLEVIQLILAVFKLTFNNIMAPLLKKHAKANVTSTVSTSLQLLVVLNVIVVPCLVVLFVSPACFREAFTTPDPVTSSFIYTGNCLTFNDIVLNGTEAIRCTPHHTVVDVTSYTPQFAYSYQCSASFVTYYAPTFVIMCIISAFVVPALRVLLVWLRYRLPRGSVLYSLVVSATPRTLRDLPSAESVLEGGQNPFKSPVFNSGGVIMSLLTYLALLLTFGALFPPLALCCAFAMVSIVLAARLEVGCFVSEAVAAARPDCVRDLERSCTDVISLQALRRALYLIFTVSCLFYTLFLYDTLGYQVGVERAFWVLVVVPLLPFAAVMLAYAYRDLATVTGRSGSDEAAAMERAVVGAGAAVEMGEVRSEIYSAGDVKGYVDTTAGYSNNPMHASKA